MTRLRQKCVVFLVPYNPQRERVQCTIVIDCCQERFVYIAATVLQTAMSPPLVRSSTALADGLLRDAPH